MSIDINKKILLNKKHIVMIFLKDFFAKFLLTNFSSWLAASILILAVLAFVSIAIASRFDDPLGNGNKVSATFGYTGIVAGVLSFILFIITWFVEFVAVFVFIIRSQIAFPGFAIRLLVLLAIAFLLIYFLIKENWVIIKWIIRLWFNGNVEFIISHFFYSQFQQLSSSAWNPFSKSW